MVQWVKNLTAVAQVAEEAQVQSPAQCSGLKGLVWVAAAAQIQSLVRELPSAVSAAIKLNFFKKIEIYSDKS